MLSRGCSIVLITALVACTAVNGEIVTSGLLDNEKESGRNITLSDQINQLLDLFSPHRLSESWLNIKDMLNTNCSRDVEHYLEGLSEHKLWAMKSKALITLVCCLLNCYIVECSNGHCCGQQIGLSFSKIIQHIGVKKERRIVDFG